MNSKLTHLFSIQSPRGYASRFIFLFLFSFSASRIFSFHARLHWIGHKLTAFGGNKKIFLNLNVENCFCESKVNLLWEKIIQFCNQWFTVSVDCRVSITSRVMLNWPRAIFQSVDDRKIIYSQKRRTEWDGNRTTQSN